VNAIHFAEGSMTRRFLRPGLTLALLLTAATGCSTIAGSLPAGAARTASPTALHASPETYRGQTVMLGGTIAAMHPHPDGIDLEVVGRALGGDGRPESGERTTGRFIVRTAEALDPTIYAPGRSITAVGEVAPMESWNFGDSSYRYPVLTSAQLLLWPPDTTTGGVYVGPRYWVWPYAFWQGPPPYVPRVTTW
jgi:outer membrane lipoprotein